MPARLGIAFALVALGQRSIEEFAPLTYLVHTLNSRQYRGVAEPYLLELCRQPEVRLAVYKFVANATKDEKLGLARILSQVGATKPSRKSNGSPKTRILKLLPKASKLCELSVHA